MWMRYLKSSETINSTVVNQNYSYPIAKRVLPKFIPRDTIELGTWLTINLKDIKLDNYVDITLESAVDPSSYIVVYESEVYFSPVRCFIDENNFLYFKASITHPAGEETYGNYAIYYLTPNLRYIKPIQNGPSEDGISGWDKLQDYQVTTEDDAKNYYAATTQEIDGLTYEINLDSNNFYNFSFVNSNTDWKNGETKYPGAKLYISFSGPFLYLFGSKGPDFGMAKVTATALADEENPIANSITFERIIDCYYPTYIENTIIFIASFLELEFRDYVLNLQVLSDKAPESRGNKFKINSYRFNYNIYRSFEEEQLSGKMVLVSTGFFR